jgi:ribosomal subunit interface protein
VNYNIKGTDLPITDELRAYVERQLAHAERLLAGDSTAHADIELRYLPEGRSGKYCAEFNVRAGGELYRTESWGATMHEAIDVAGGELVRELSRDKKRRLHMLRRTAIRVKEYLRGWRDKM